MFLFCVAIVGGIRRPPLPESEPAGSYAGSYLQSIRLSGLIPDTTVSPALPLTRTRRVGGPHSILDYPARRTMVPARRRPAHRKYGLCVVIDAASAPQTATSLSNTEGRITDRSSPNWVGRNKFRTDRPGSADPNRQFGIGTHPSRCPTRLSPHPNPNLAPRPIHLLRAAVARRPRRSDPPSSGETEHCPPPAPTAPENGGRPGRRVSRKADPAPGCTE